MKNIDFKSFALGAALAGAIVLGAAFGPKEVTNANATPGDFLALFERINDAYGSDIFVFPTDESQYYVIGGELHHEVHGRMSKDKTYETLAEGVDTLERLIAEGMEPREALRQLDRLDRRRRN